MHRLTLKDYDQYLKTWGEENEYPPLDSRLKQWVKHLFPHKNNEVLFDYMDKVFKGFYIDSNTLVYAFIDNQSVLEPHFHLIGWDEFHVVISLIKPELVNHGFTNSPITDMQYHNIIEWLERVPDSSKESHWSEMVATWNFSSWNYYKCNVNTMPDYTLLREE